jgi:uncharacterized protein (UPF0332 family)
MPTSLHEILALAERLHEMRESEATARSAVSRAYYAALHATKNTFDARPRFGDESSHAEIIGRATAYGSAVHPGRTEANQIAMWLPRLRRLRNKADYDLESELSHDDAHGHLARVKLILESCDAIQRKRREAADKAVD